MLLGESNVHTKDIVWKNMIKEIDLNGDGQISFEEFKTLMNKVILRNSKTHNTVILHSEVEDLNIIKNKETNNTIKDVIHTG